MVNFISLFTPNKQGGGRVATGDHRHQIISRSLSKPALSLLSATVYWNCLRSSWVHSSL